MSSQPSTQKCPLCLQHASPIVCQHAFLYAENTRVQDLALSNSNAEVRSREPPPYVTYEAGAAVHIIRDAEADSDMDLKLDQVSSSDISDHTDHADYINHEVYFDISDSLDFIQHPEGGPSSYPLSAFEDIAIT
jgi:hypothetical protein